MLIVLILAFSGLNSYAESPSAEPLNLRVINLGKLTDQYHLMNVKARREYLLQFFELTLEVYVGARSFQLSAQQVNSYYSKFNAMLAKLYRTNQMPIELKRFYREHAGPSKIDQVQILYEQDKDVSLLVIAQNFSKFLLGVGTQACENLVMNFDHRMWRGAILGTQMLHAYWEDWTEQRGMRILLEYNRIMRYGEDRYLTCKRRLHLRRLHMERNPQLQRQLRTEEEHNEEEPL